MSTEKFLLIVNVTDKFLNYQEELIFSARIISSSISDIAIFFFLSYVLIRTVYSFIFYKSGKQNTKNLNLFSKNSKKFDLNNEIDNSEKNFDKSEITEENIDYKEKKNQLVVDLIEEDEDEIETNEKIQNEEKQLKNFDINKQEEIINENYIQKKPKIKFSKRIKDFSINIYKRIVNCYFFKNNLVRYLSYVQFFEFFSCLSNLISIFYMFGIQDKDNDFLCQLQG